MGRAEGARHAGRGRVHRRHRRRSRGRHPEQLLRGPARLTLGFRDTADLYDAFYDALDKDYAAEAGTVLRHVRRHNRRPRTLLDVACGTGRHLEAFLGRGLECVGLDIHRGMLDVARRRCPAVELVEADMSTFDLGRTFDVVTCLFSSVAYSPTVAALRQAVRRMAAHLDADHGVLVVEPWFQPEEWEDGYVGLLTVDEPTRKAVRISRSGRRRDMSILDFDYLIADGSGTRHVQERHELRLFTWDQYVEAFERAGLAVETDDYGLFGRGLLIGTFA